MMRPALLAACALLMATTTVSALGDATIGYKPILRSSATVPGTPFKFGQLLTKQMTPVYKVGPDGKRTAQLEISNEPDFSSLHPVGDKLYLITHFEAPRPGSMYVVELNQAKNGSLTPKSMKYVSWAAEHGLWIPCAGSITPWASRLLGEEYEPDARPLSEATSLADLKARYGESDWGDVEGFMRYYDLYPAQITLQAVKSKFNPYRYGHIAENAIKPDGTVTAVKHYALGRAAWELALVMPDRRTVYGTDDGSNVGFFKFVAKRAGDLSEGSLYAGKFTQTNAVNGGRFDIDWILLGTGKDAEIRALAEGSTFADIFDTAEFDSEAAKCPAGFKSVNQDDKGPECLKLKTGMAKAAAFLETRRYAAYKGATTEFSKWEGITLDPARNVLYTAMSAIREGMEDRMVKGKPNTERDIGGPNHVRLPYNKCGCVYAVSLDKQYDAVSMQGLICGSDNPDETDENNSCALNGISSPDNVKVMPQADALLIAEDTSGHQNNMLWSLDLKTKALTRIATAPYGAEWTGAYFYPSIKGHTYAVAVVQHPYEGLSDKAAEPQSSGINAWVGYWTWPRERMAGATRVRFQNVKVPRTNAEKHAVGFTKQATFIGKKSRKM